MGFFDFLTGTGGKLKQAKVSPEAQEALEQLLKGGITEDELYNLGGDYLKQLFSGDYAAFEAPLIEQFEQQIVPGIAERFAGVGGMSSSGLNLALAEAAKGLSTQLGAQRAGLMQSTLGQALGYAEAPYQQMAKGLQLQPEQYYQPGRFGLLSELLKGLKFNIHKTL